MARDYIHDAVREALEKDGWIVTEDPLLVSVGKTSAQIDLAAEKMMFAERGTEYIAVEIKSFKRPSLLNAFYETLGQYLIYREALLQEGSYRTLFLAISTSTHHRIDEFQFLRERVVQFGIKILVVNVEQKEIIQWFK